MILKPTWLVPETDQKMLQSDNVFIYGLDILMST